MVILIMIKYQFHIKIKLSFQIQYVLTLSTYNPILAELAISARWTSVVNGNFQLILLDFY